MIAQLVELALVICVAGMLFCLLSIIAALADTTAANKRRRKRKR